MKTLALFVVVLSAIIYNTDALNCITCTYTEVPDELADSGFAGFGNDNDVTCRDGGSSLTAYPCPAAETGMKPVCIRSKGVVNVKVTAGDQKQDVEFTTYSRACHTVADTEAADGELPISIFQDDVDGMFDFFNQNTGGLFNIEVKDYGGSVEYCSTDGCGTGEDLSKLSGVGAVLPSLVLMGLLAVLAHFF